MVREITVITLNVKIIFIVNSGGMQLRIHRPDIGIFARYRIFDSLVRVVLEFPKNILQMNIGDKSNLYLFLIYLRYGFTSR